MLAGNIGKPPEPVYLAGYRTRTIARREHRMWRKDLYGSRVPCEKRSPDQRDFPERAHAYRPDTNQRRPYSRTGSKRTDRAISFAGHQIRTDEDWDAGAHRRT